MKYCDTCHFAYPDDFAICPRDQGPLRVASELLPGMVGPLFHAAIRSAEVQRRTHVRRSRAEERHQVERSRP